MQACDKLTRRCRMLPEGGLVLVALSGGMDSMCLLDYLASQGVPLAAAHFNHRLRGKASDGDEAFVRAYCREHQIPVYVGSADVRAEAERSGQGIEETARQLRYAFLEQTAQEIGADKIATAHHADDCAETVLFHLIRGTGADGMGIPAVRGRFIRPLLTTSREEIAAYVHSRRIPYREDETNRDTAYSRNFIRHRVMPLLQTLNPHAGTHIAQAAERLQKESAYLDTLAAQAMHGFTAREERVSLPCAALTAADEVLRGRMVRQMLGALAVGKKDFTAAHIDAVVALAFGDGTAGLDLPHGAAAERRDGVLSIFLSARTAPQEALLDCGQTLIWGKYKISLRKTPKTRLSGEDIFCCLRDTITLPLRVRSWQPHERIVLSGTDKPRTLKRLFTEAGIAAQERGFLPVIESGGAVAAVVPLGAAAAFSAASGYDLQIEKT